MRLAFEPGADHRLVTVLYDHEGVVLLIIELGLVEIQAWLVLERLARCRACRDTVPALVTEVCEHCNLICLVHSESGTPRLDEIPAVDGQRRKLSNESLRLVRHQCNVRAHANAQAADRVAIDATAGLQLSLLDGVRERGFVEVVPDR